MCNQSWNKILFTWANFCFTKYTYLCEKYCMSFNKENTKERIRRLKVRGEQPIPADTDVLYILLPIPVWSAVCLIVYHSRIVLLATEIYMYNCTMYMHPGLFWSACKWRRMSNVTVQCHCPCSECREEG